MELLVNTASSTLLQRDRDRQSRAVGDSSSVRTEIQPALIA